MSHPIDPISRAWDKLTNWGDGVLHVWCATCGETRVLRMENLRRGMPASTPIDILPGIIGGAMCPRGRVGCVIESERVSPDDGVSEEG